MTSPSSAPLAQPGEPWSPRGRPVAVAVTLLIAAVVLCAGAIVSGAVTPDIQIDGVQWATGPRPGTDPATVSMVVRVSNHRSLPVRVEAVGRSIPGLQLASWTVVEGRLRPVEPAGGPMVRLGRGQGIEVLVTYRVVDCAAVPTGPVGLPVRVRTGLRGSLTRVLRLSLTSRPDAPATRIYSGRDPWAEPWPVTLTRTACRR